MSAGRTNAPSEARDHEFEEELVNAPPGQERLSIENIREVRLELSADLGQCEVQVRDILEMKMGTVLPLNKLAGEMADVYVNGIPFARGEVVVLVDSLHVRIAEVIGATEKDLDYA